MLTKCTIKMLYGRYGDRLCHPSISPLTTALSDERFRPNALLMFYKSVIIQHKAALPIKISIYREGLVAL